MNLCFLLCFTILTKVLCQNETSKNISSEDIGAYRIYKGCPDGDYYSDVAGIVMRCELYPWIGSKHELCWREVWWKVYQSDSVSQFGLSNPFDFLPIDSCRSKCLCKITMDMHQFQCLDKGARLGWNAYLPPYTKYRPVFHCNEFTLPTSFAKLDNKTVEFVVSITNAPSTSTPMTADSTNFNTLAQKIIASGFSVNGWIINVTNPVMQRNTFDTAESYLYNLSFTTDMRRLDIINAESPLQFPDLDLILSNFSSSLEFFRLEGFDVTQLPDHSQPSFVESLKALVIKNALNFNKLPSWLPKAKNLVVLMLNQISSDFNWDTLKPMANLQYFSLTNTPVSNLPTQVIFATLFPKLEYLDLSNMNMASIRKNLLTNLVNLRFLDLSGNDLSSLPSFGGLKNLQWLGLAGISVTDNKKASTCFYGQTKKIALTQSDFTDQSNLITLDVSNYESISLSDDALVPLINLEVFKATCAGLNQIPNALKNACRLRELHLAFNQLNASEAIPMFLITELIQLSIFGLRYNGITTMQQALLSFPNTNYNLIDSIKNSMIDNPVSGNPCEMHRFETAYNQEPRINSQKNAFAQCDASYGSATAKPGAVATVRLCKPLKPRPPVVQVVDGSSKMSASIVITLIALISLKLVDC